METCVFRGCELKLTLTILQLCVGAVVKLGVPLTAEMGEVSGNLSRVGKSPNVGQYFRVEGGQREQEGNTQT